MQAQDKPEYAAPAPTLVVLDTNVVLDAWLFADTAAAPLRAGLRAGRLRWLATPAMLAELRDVLGRPLPTKWEGAREHLLSYDFEAECTLRPEPVLPPSQRLLCSDPADQKFIDLALSQGCAWLFSHDKALLKLAPRARLRGLVVAEPRRFVG